MGGEAAVGNLSALRLRFKPEKCLPPESTPYRCVCKEVSLAPRGSRGRVLHVGRVGVPGGGGFPERGLPGKLRDELGMGAL